MVASETADYRTDDGEGDESRNAPASRRDSQAAPDHSAKSSSDEKAGGLLSGSRGAGRGPALGAVDLCMLHESFLELRELGQLP